jgi:hypothetical protein
VNFRQISHTPVGDFVHFRCACGIRIAGLEPEAYQAALAHYGFPAWAQVFLRGESPLEPERVVDIGENFECPDCSTRELPELEERPDISPNGPARSESVLVLAGPHSRKRKPRKAS